LASRCLGFGSEGAVEQSPGQSPGYADVDEKRPSPEGATHPFLHNFGGFVGKTPDGSQPWGSLTPVLTSAGMMIFGRTTYGGTHQDGVIFMMKPFGSDYQIVHSFGPGSGNGSQPHHDQLRQVGNAASPARPATARMASTTSSSGTE
jgi:hypothetical protein